MLAALSSTGLERSSLFIKSQIPRMNLVTPDRLLSAENVHKHKFFDKDVILFAKSLCSIAEWLESFCKHSKLNNNCLPFTLQFVPIQICDVCTKREKIKKACSAVSPQKIWNSLWCKYERYQTFVNQNDNISNKNKIYARHIELSISDKNKIDRVSRAVGDWQW